MKTIKGGSTNWKNAGGNAKNARSKVMHHHLMAGEFEHYYHEVDPGVPFHEDYRTMPADHVWIPNLAGWIPVYARGYGSLCLVALTDGNKFYSGISTKWVFDKLLDFYDINYSTTRQKYFACTGRYQSTALLIHNRNTFLFAVKGRHTNGPWSGRNDGAFGYLVDDCVEEVHSLGSTHVRVRLSADHKLDLHMSRTAFEKQRNDAHHFHLCMKQRDRV